VRPLLAAAAALAWLSVPAAGAEEEALNGTQRSEVTEMIQAYIMNNPHVIARALARMGPDAAGGNTGELLRAATAAAKAAFADPSQGAAVVINPSGTTTLAEAFDYACPFSRTVAPRVEDLLRRRPDVRLVLREAPILTPESEIAARVGLAVASQGAQRYRAYHFALMARRGPLTEQAIIEAAAAAGADLAAVADAASGAAVTRGLQANVALLRGVGAVATPMFAAGGQAVNGALQPLDLAALLAGHSSP
jgi:protein-disulfide isomerase